MRTHFHHEIADLAQALAELGNDVCKNVTCAVESLRSADKSLAVKVMRSDRDIDRREVRNEESCLKIIALHQPVADDLRYLVVMLKVNHELERISDLAVDIAETVHLLVPEACAPWCDKIGALAEAVAGRVKQVLTALLLRDAREARDLWMADTEINTASIELQDELRRNIISAKNGQDTLFALLKAVDRLERLADHVKNIAKDIIYLVLGEIARHRSSEFLGENNERKHVLFVCIHNSARSQMAEAWLNQFHGDRFEAESAGLEPGELNPLAIQVMAEAGIDISKNQTKDVFDIVKSGRHFDYLITVCDEASAEKCPPALGTIQELHWSFPDPATVPGADAEKLGQVREIRDAIKAHVEAWVNELQPTVAES